MDKRKVSDEEERKSNSILKKAKKEKKEKKHKKSKKEKKAKHKHSSNKPVPPANQISEAAFYEKRPEFSSWLYDQHIFLADLDSHELSSKFSQFVHAWNSGTLNRGYDPAAAKKKTASSFNWNIKMDSQDQQKLKDHKSQIRRNTYFASEPASPPQASQQRSAIPERTLSSTHRIGPRRPNQDSESESSSDSDFEQKERRRRRQEDKKFQNKKTQDLEELVPKKEGRERQIENRKMKGAYARPKGDESVELDDNAIFGGGDQNELKRKIEAQRRERAAREEKRTQDYELKKEALAAKEQKAMAPFLELVRSGNFVNPLTKKQ